MFTPISDSSSTNSFAETDSPFDDEDELSLLPGVQELRQRISINVKERNSLFIFVPIIDCLYNIY